MPETRKYETNEMVDIDNSGPEVDVTLPEEKKQEEVQNEEPSDSNKVIVEEVKEDVKEPEQEPEQKTEEPVKEDKVQEDKSVEDKKELEDYSEGVKRRIAKLTKKMREAERQKEAALEYAKGVKAEADKTKTRLSTMEPGYMTAMEGRVASGLEAAAAKLAAAREAGDLKAEIEAQKQIAKLGLEEARVELMKKKAEAESKQKPVKQSTLEDAIKPKASISCVKSSNCVSDSGFKLSKISDNTKGNIFWLIPIDTMLVFKFFPKTSYTWSAPPSMPPAYSVANFSLVFIIDFCLTASFSLNWLFPANWFFTVEKASFTFLSLAKVASKLSDIFISS